MDESLKANVEATANSRFRAIVVALLALAVTAAHWWTPQGQDYLHAIHILLRKLYVLPVVLAAIWFDLRAALFAAGAVTFLYAPHVVWHWGGQRAENLNQAGEIVTIWATAAIAGVLLVGAEKGALRRLAGAYEGIVRALVAALDMREHDTELHSLRVRASTLRLGDELEVGGDTQHASPCTRAGTAHRRHSPLTSPTHPFQAPPYGLAPRTLPGRVRPRYPRSTCLPRRFKTPGHAWEGIVVAASSRAGSSQCQLRRARYGAQWPPNGRNHASDATGPRFCLRRPSGGSQSAVVNDTPAIYGYAGGTAALHRKPTTPTSNN